MDFTLTPKHVYTADEAICATHEQPVDLDFTLPDYCEDVEKILKCTVNPEIYSTNLSGGQLSVEGSSVIRILYSSKDKKILRCAEQSIPFQSTFNISTDSDEFATYVKAETQYANCKAVSKRRLMVHGAVIIKVKVKQKKASKLYLPDESKELQTLMKTTKISELTSLQSEAFSVNESIMTDNNIPVSTILRTELNSILSDVTAIGNRMIIKGELTFSMLYSSEQHSDVPQQFTYVFPFTHNMQCPEGEKAHVKEIDLSVMSYDYKLKSDITTDSPVVVLDAKLCATVACRVEKEVSYISDAYSTTSDTTLEYTKLKVDTDVHPKISSFMCKSLVNVSDASISRILDIFCDSVTVTPTVTDKLRLTGKANFCILALDENSELVYLERSIDIDNEEPLSMLYTGFSDVSSMVKSISFRLTDAESLELRAEILVYIKLLKTDNILAVSKIIDSGVSVRDESCALTLYFAESDESVWDIAKRYKTDRNALIKENDITGDRLPEKMLLLIPEP